jgi:hypothetical protein
VSEEADNLKAERKDRAQMRSLESVASRFQLDDKGQFAGGSKQAYAYVQKQIAKKVEREMESLRALEPPKIKRIEPVYKSIYQTDPPKLGVEFYTLQGLNKFDDSNDSTGVALGNQGEWKTVRDCDNNEFQVFTRPVPE